MLFQSNKIFVYIIYYLLPFFVYSQNKDSLSILSTEIKGQVSYSYYNGYKSRSYFAEVQSLFSMTKKTQLGLSLRYERRNLLLNQKYDCYCYIPAIYDISPFEKAYNLYGDNIALSPRIRYGVNFSKIKITPFAGSGIIVNYLISMKEHNDKIILAPDTPAELLFKEMTNDVTSYFNRFDTGFIIETGININVKRFSITTGVLLQLGLSEIGGTEFQYFNNNHSSKKQSLKLNRWAYNSLGIFTGISF